MAANHRKFRETTEHTHCLRCGRCLPGLLFCSLNCLLDDVNATLGADSLRAVLGAIAAAGLNAEDFEASRSVVMALEAREKMRARLASMATPTRNPKLN